MDNFEVKIEITYTEAAFKYVQARSPALDPRISLPGGVALPMLGDEVAFLADAHDEERVEFITFRVSARRFLLQGLLPEMTLILTLDLLESPSE